MQCKWSHQNSRRNKGKKIHHTQVKQKKKIAQNRKESARTGGGRAAATELTPLQEKVSEIFGRYPY